MSDLNPDELVHFGHPLGQGPFLGISTPRIVAAGVTAGLVLADLLAFQNALGVIGLVGAGGSVVGVRLGDRKVADWVPIVARFLTHRALGINRFRSTRPWRAIVTGEPAAEVERKPLEDLPTGWEGPLRNVRLLGFSANAHEEPVGVLAEDGRYRVVMEIAGGHSLEMLDTPDALARLDEWGDVLVSCVTEDRPFSRLQTIVKLSADAGLAWAAYRREKARLPVGHPIRDSLERVTEEQRPERRSLTAFLVAELDLAEVPSDQVRYAGRGDVGACQLLTERISNTLVGALSDAGISVSKMLEPRDVAELLRLTLDPFSARAVADRQDQSGEAGVDPAAAEPDALDVGWSYSRCDASWAITGYVREYPQQDVHVSALGRLMVDPRFEVVVSQVLEPQSRATVKGQVTKAWRKGKTASATLDAIGIEDNPFREQARVASEEITAAVAGGAAVYRHNLYVLAAGRTPMEAERAWSDVVVAGAKAGCEVARLYGNQDAGLAAVLPLCRGV